ncbi:hypothetical protein CIW55_09175 [Enterobacter cloacae]|nr:hypothetical protein CIW55_09175 [Enterobacter cloacae]PAO14802.1 hypothetical protein CIW58_09445 [Enterobacter cloacae]
MILTKPIHCRKLLVVGAENITAATASSLCLKYILCLLKVAIYKRLVRVLSSVTLRILAILMNARLPIKSVRSKMVQDKENG